MLHVQKERRKEAHSRAMELTIPLNLNYPSTHLRLAHGSSFLRKHFPNW